MLLLRAVNPGCTIPRVLRLSSVGGVADVTASSPHLDLDRHPIDDESYITRCRDVLGRDGALVLHGFARRDTIEQIVAQSSPLEGEAFYADTTHNVYLTPADPAFASDHPFNRQVESSKGLIADDQIPPDSPLRDIYDDASFRTFLCGVLDVDQIYPYSDDLSSINVHFAAEGMELGWHFDNSSFAVTMLLQAPQRGARFEHVPAVRDADAGEMAYEEVQRVLDGEATVRTLHFQPGDLVLFRGRDAIHRVTPTEGETTRILVVFAYNDRPGVALSESALATFYGRAG